MQERRIGDIAIDAVDWIMEHEYVPKQIVGYTIERNATFNRCMQYLWTFVGNGAPHRGQRYRPRHRFDFYKRIIRQYQSQIKGGLIQHIDLGCGGGTFSQAMLEWHQARGMEYNRVSLYGYDYAPNMVKAARMIHRYIQTQHTQNIPNLRAYNDYKVMLEGIPENPPEPTHYIITTGYVLANNNDEQAIADFVNIITTVVNKAGDHPCSIIVCDSNTIRALAPPYDRLVRSLQSNGVNVITQYEEAGVRIAELYR